MKAAPLPILALLACLALPGAAMAHPKLLAATPAADAAVASPAKATLNFSETLIGPVSGIDLVKVGPTPTKVAGVKTALGPDRKTLVATFPAKLAPGAYQLDWHVVSTDTHKLKGSYSFTVK